MRLLLHDSPALDGFLSTGNNLDFRLLRSQLRMDGFEPYFSGFFLGSNPNSPGSADQRKWIVANDLGGTIQLKLDRVVRKWPNRAEFCLLYTSRCV